MSFFKKLGETMKDTASSIGAKSIDMMESGKLKLQQIQLENSMKDKKTEIGNLIYLAQKQNVEPDTDALRKVFSEIKNLEDQLADIDEKLHKETVETASEPAPVEEKEPSVSTVRCPKCGIELVKGAKFCNSCGEPQ